MLSFDVERGTLQFSAAHCEVRGWQLAAECGGRLLSSPMAQATVADETSLHLLLSFPDLGIRWQVDAEEDAADATVVLTSHLTNESHEPLALGRVYLLRTDEPVRVGTDTDELVCLPLSGHISPRCVYRLVDPDCPRTSKIKLQLLNRRDSAAMQVGFLTFRRVNTEVEHECGPSGGITGLRAFCDFAGWELKPGASTCTESFILAAGDDPYAQLEAWADRAAALCAPRQWQDAPIGWLGWAWVDPFTVETYQDVLIEKDVVWSEAVVV